MNWRLHVTLIAVLFMTCTSSTHSHADDCDARAAALVAQEPNISVEERRGDYIVLESPHADEASIGCAIANGPPLDLDLIWHGAFPPASFYEFVGRAGYVEFNQPPNGIARGAERCAQTALRAPDGNGALKAGGVYFECTALDGSTGVDPLTEITIFPASAAPKP